MTYQLAIIARSMRLIMKIKKLMSFYSERYESCQLANIFLLIVNIACKRMIAKKSAN